MLAGLITRAAFSMRLARTSAWLRSLFTAWDQRWQRGLFLTRAVWRSRKLSVRARWWMRKGLICVSVICLSGICLSGICLSGISCVEDGPFVLQGAAVSGAFGEEEGDLIGAAADAEAADGSVPDFGLEEIEEDLRPRGRWLLLRGGARGRCGRCGGWRGCGRVRLLPELR